MEQPQGSPLPITGDSSMSVPVHPFEIQSVRIDYPHKPSSTQTMQVWRQKAEAEPSGQVDQ
jgi:alpha-mannosidase